MYLFVHALSDTEIWMIISLKANFLFLIYYVFYYKYSRWFLLCNPMKFKSCDIIFHNYSWLKWIHSEGSQFSEQYIRFHLFSIIFIINCRSQWKSGNSNWMRFAIHFCIKNWSIYINSNIHYIVEEFFIILKMYFSAYSIYIKPLSNW